MDSDTQMWGRRTGAEPADQAAELGHPFEQPGGHSYPPPAAPSRPSPGGGRGLFPLLASALVAAVTSVVVTLGVVEARDGAAPAGGAQHVQPEPAAGADRVANRSQPPAESLAEGSTIADVAEAVLPSVAQVQVRTPQGGGEGSAVVYRSDGLLVTNNHVVENAVEVRVVLSDSTSYPAEVVGTDPNSDIALLQIDATDLPVPVYADDTPRIGSTAIAIGSPFGLESTVTSGIVSATERVIPAGRQGGGSTFPLVGVIQTDAAINPGNSGGALVDGQGRIIGINTAIFSQSGTSAGIGFAVPVSTVQTVAEALLDEGEVRYAYLGISSTDVTPEVAERFGLDSAAGAVVMQVVGGSPAEDAGLRQGDIITRIADRPVTETNDIFAALVNYSPGDEVTVTYLRDGRERTTEVTLGARPDEL